MEIVRCLLPDIIAYCEPEQGQKEFEEWKKAKEIQTHTTVEHKETRNK